MKMIILTVKGYLTYIENECFINLYLKKHQTHISYGN